MKIQEAEVIQPQKLRDTLTKQVAEECRQSESVVEKVISFQFKDALDNITSVCDLEFLSLGAFKMSFNKARRKFNKHEEILRKVKARLPTSKEEKRNANDLLKIKYLEESVAYTQDAMNRIKDKENTKLNKTRESKLERDTGGDVELIVY